jgi:putative transcriptional regulator
MPHAGQASYPASDRQHSQRERVSQSVFARHLGLSINVISQWERGEKKPSGASLKLLTLVDKKGLDWVA